MAQTTYSIPVQPTDRAIAVACAVFNHLVAWKQLYNIDFISAVRNGANIDWTFSDAIPQPELSVIRLSF